MGLGFYIVGDIPRSGILRKKMPPPKLFDEFIKAVIDRISRHPLRPFVRTENRGLSCDLAIYPAEEPLNLSVEEGRLIISSRTSSAGPGYHKFLIELVERVSKDLSIELSWTNPDNDIGDETGYHESRDFKILQIENFRWLQAIARHVCSSTTNECISLSLPVGFHVLGNYFAASPRGFWEREYFEAVVAANEDQMHEYAPKFLPWWNSEPDQDFWDGLGDVLCWSIVPWHVPHDDSERGFMHATVNVLNKCSIPSVQEIRELQELLTEGRDDSTPPREDGRGFFRRSLRHLVVGGWTIELPGFYYHSIEDEGAKEVFWFADRTIHISAYSMSGSSKQEAIGDHFDAPDGSETVTFENGHLIGRGHVSQVEEESKKYGMLQAGVATDERLAFLTICFDSPNDEHWAINTWKSVFRPVEN